MGLNRLAHLRRSIKLAAKQKHIGMYKLVSSGQCTLPEWVVKEDTDNGFLLIDPNMKWNPIVLKEHQAPVSVQENSAADDYLDSLSERW